MAAVVNSGDHGFASNQVLGSLPVNAGHLAGLSGVDFSSIDGDQFFRIPEPASLAMAGLASLAMICTRRRS